MKLIYICEKWIDMYKRWLTPYHIYDIDPTYTKVDSYMIICNNKEKMTFPKSWFIPLDQWRDMRINKLLNE